MRSKVYFLFLSVRLRLLTIFLNKSNRKRMTRVPSLVIAINLSKLIDPYHLDRLISFKENLASH